MVEPKFSIRRIFGHFSRSSLQIARYLRLMHVKTASKSASTIVSNPNGNSGLKNKAVALFRTRLSAMTQNRLLGISLSTKFSLFKFPILPIRQHGIRVFSTTATAVITSQCEVKIAAFHVDIHA